ncbi:MAG: response regulator [Gemmataceae bacterium]|nr:response regulator [Gemmataceae bacterium]
MPTESIILCEGYYDRAFWTGCLLATGCRDARNQADGTPIQGPVLDLAGKQVKGGQYGFWSASGNFLRIVPCHGKSKILPEARSRLNRRKTDPFQRLVLNIDPDTVPGEPATGLQLQDIEAIVKVIDPNVTIDAQGNVSLDKGAVLVNLIRWEAADQSPKLPTKQSLERLVCACLQAGFPERTDLVLMDVQLPGIDGVTFVRELKANPQTADIPVVAVSAHAMAHTIQEAMAAGCAAYVTKPVTDDPFVFLEKLRRIIQASATA